MECLECGGNVLHKFGSYKFNSRILGEIVIPNIRYEECNQCGDKYVKSKESNKIISIVKQKEKEAIERLPFDQFISMSEAAELLGCTKQAFSKNPRIRRGLIMHGIIDGRKYYLKKSVLLFKETNNGLFLLPGVSETYTISENKDEVDTQVAGSVGAVVFYDEGSQYHYQKQSWMHLSKNELITS